MGGERFTFSQVEAKKTLKVFLWTMASALVVLGIDLVSAFDVPTQYVFLVPIANTVLYSLKEFIADNR